MKAELERRVAKAKVELKGKPRLGVEALAAKADSDSYYMFYKMLSSGSAHPSLHWLSKHLLMNDDGTWSGHVTGPDAEEMAGVLALGANALLVTLANFNGVWSGGDGASEVQAFIDEHLVLAEVHPRAGQVAP